jgi:hypothetical protein
MNIFKLRPGDSGFIPLTEETYFAASQRKAPYKTTTKDGRALYLAVCPECGNPIEIRNLGPVADTNLEDAKKPFGKHYIFDVPGLADSDRTRYEECSLRGEVSIGTKKLRKSKEFNHQLLRLIVEHALVIRDMFVQCIGVTVSERLFTTIINEFVSRESYKSKGVQPSNLPFAIAYWAENQSLMGQLVSDSGLRAALTGKKKFCIGERGDVARREGIPFSNQVRFYFAGRHKDDGEGHHKGNEERDEPNIIKLHVASYNGETLGTDIYTKPVYYRNNDFFDAIKRETRATTAAAVAKREKWSAIVRAIVEQSCPEALQPS